MEKPLTDAPYISRVVTGNNVMPPVRARHIEWSAVSSVDDLRPAASQSLVRLLLEAANRAIDISLDEVSGRCASEFESQYVNVWPGEHYRLLRGLVEVVQPKLVVEVGTSTGMGTLALQSPSAGNRVVSFDIEAWDSFPTTLLRRQDFDGGIEQRIGNLADTKYFEANIDVLKSAEIIFVDGPKDEVFEPVFIGALVEILSLDQLVIFDDIRLLRTRMPLLTRLMVARRGTACTS